MSVVSDPHVLACTERDPPATADRYRDRPVGISSRMCRAAGPRHQWTAPNGQVVDLPVTIDLVNLHPMDGSVIWALITTVDLCRGEPRLVQVVAEAPGGLDHVRLQREFRWASPVDIVRRGVPALLARGIDPFQYEFPADGYPKSAELQTDAAWRLTDDFLEEIARRYLDIGRGYARTIASERSVTPRTAVSWVEKARRRGILSRVPRGSHGGQIIPADQRRGGTTPEPLGDGRAGGITDLGQ
jgi:hypothetical protein